MLTPMSLQERQRRWWVPIGPCGQQVRENCRGRARPPLRLSGPDSGMVCACVYMCVCVFFIGLSSIIRGGVCVYSLLGCMSILYWVIFKNTGVCVCVPVCVCVCVCVSIL